MDVHLWEVGVLLVGIAFIVGAIYLAKTMKNLAKAIEDISLIVIDNKKHIDEIVKDIENITKSSSYVVEDVQESVDSLKKSVLNVEKTVSSTKNYMLRPVLTTLNVTHSALKMVGAFTSKKKK